MKTPNNEEKEEGEDTQKQQFLVSFFFFPGLFYFDEVLLNRQSNSLEILYYEKQEKGLIFCNYIF